VDQAVEDHETGEAVARTAPKSAWTVRSSAPGAEIAATRSPNAGPKEPSWRTASGHRAPWPDALGSPATLRRLRGHAVPAKDSVERRLVVAFSLDEALDDERSSASSQPV
jgi:hypothetical protein